MSGAREARTRPDKPAAGALGLVVARYAEDLSWLSAMRAPGVIYNKGAALPPGATPPGFVETPLPNVGREAHTFLTHIVASYDNLPPCTAFLQGDPFAHLAPPDAPRPTPGDLAARLDELVATGRPFTGLAWFRLRCDGLGRPHDLADPAKKGRWKGWGRDIPVAETFEALFGRPAPRWIIARAPTGNMLVRRERILARPRAFYQRALDLVLADPDDARNTGHAIERLWQTIFSGARDSADPTEI